MIDDTKRCRRSFFGALSSTKPLKRWLQWAAPSHNGTRFQEGAFTLI